MTVNMCVISVCVYIKYGYLHILFVCLSMHIVFCEHTYGATVILSLCCIQ